MIETLVTTATRPKIVIGVDPGTNTGVVVWDNEKHCVLAHIVDKPQAVYAALISTTQSMIHQGVRPVLVIERLDLSQDTLRKTRAGIDDLIHILGATWALATFFNLEYHEVGRSDTKNFAHDEALQRRGLWLESRHTRDALRAVITWLASHDNEFAKRWAFTEDN
jgi:hypothetical protein